MTNKEKLEVLQILKRIGIELKLMYWQISEDNMRIMYGIEMKKLINVEDAKKIKEWLNDKD